jgi:conjugal transfer pilus assembly protein TraB
MIQSAFHLKKRQYIVGGAIGLLLIAAILIILYSVEEEIVPESKPSQKKTVIATAGEQINSQELWVDRMESENKIMEKKIEVLRQAFENQEKASKEIKETFNLYSESQNTQTNIPASSSLPIPPREDSACLTDKPFPTAPTGMRKIVLKLSNNKLSSKDQRATVENTIPAGAFAQAVLLGGVDASTSVHSQSDPRPVLLRVTDHGNLPRKFKSDLKACHVLASSYGDLSSERVYMRLEKLTCTERLTGEISETQVSGYVVGEDGRAGMRGVVADRAGPMVRNSLVGGFLSGMGQFFSAQQKSESPLFQIGSNPKSESSLSVQQMFSSGAANGFSSALNKYADFFIKRAEQLQPVLQVAAGRQVEVVFTEGTRFGETSVKKSIEKIRNRSRKEAIQKVGAQLDKQSWIPNGES